MNNILEILKCLSLGLSPVWVTGGGPWTRRRSSGTWGGGWHPTFLPTLTGIPHTQYLVMIESPWFSTFCKRKLPVVARVVNSDVVNPDLHGQKVKFPKNSDPLEYFSVLWFRMETDADPGPGSALQPMRITAVNNKQLTTRVLWYR